MFKNNFKNIIFYFLIFLPLSIGISSCSQNKKSNFNSNIETTSDFIPVIEAVAALGQLSPAGDIRQLAACLLYTSPSPRDGT